MASVLRFDDWETTLGTSVAETDGSGNVALGGSSPSYRLDVTGDINASGALRIGGTAVGEATAFTPSWTNLTPGDATEVWKYWQINNIVVVSGRTILGSTSSVGTNPTIDVPVGTIGNRGQVFGVTNYFDSGGSIYYGGVKPGSSSTFLFRRIAVSGSDIIDSAITSTAPFTWTTSDRIIAQFVYTVE